MSKQWGHGYNTAKDEAIAIMSDALKQLKKEKPSVIKQLTMEEIYRLKRSVCSIIEGHRKMLARALDEALWMPGDRTSAETIINIVIPNEWSLEILRRDIPTIEDVASVFIYGDAELSKCNGRVRMLISSYKVAK